MKCKQSRNNKLRKIHLKKFLIWLYLVFYLRRKNEIKSFHYAKNYLSRGIFYANKKGEFRRFDKYFFFPSNLSHIYINLSNYSKYSVKRIRFSAGQGKAVIFTQDKALGYFFTQKGYDNAFRNYINYYSCFIYPSVKIFAFDKEQRCMSMNRIDGTQYFDYAHDCMIVEDLIKFAYNTPIQIGNDGLVRFLQHGDAGRSNIIWKGKTYTFIDLDNIGFYPPFLDILHYLCMCEYCLIEIISILNKYLGEINKICIRANYPTDNVLDEIFYGYTNHYIKMNACFEDISFLINGNTKDYPKTQNLLKSRFGIIG